MKFRYTILYVHDVRATLDFYARAFGQMQGFVHETGHFGELQTGETKLSFCSIALMEELGKEVAVSAPERPSFEIAFETEDVAAALEQALAAGADQVQGVEHMPWGQTTAYVRSPEGTMVEICTAVAA